MLLTHLRAKPRLFVGSLFVTAAVALAFHPSAARADFWSWLSDLVSEPEAEPRNAENVSLSGLVLPADAIVTAPGEERVIRLGKDLLQLRPSTAITFEVSGQTTTVHLFAGTVRAKVAKRENNRTFEVQTPLLIGTVKGTVFEVSTRFGVSALSVYEGRVSLRAVNGIGGIDVTPGKTGTVSARDKGARLGDTPKGGAAAAAGKVAQAAGFAERSALPDEADDSDGRARPKRHPDSKARSLDGERSDAGVASDDNDIEKVKEHHEKKSKSGESGKEHEDDDDDDDD